MKKPLLILAIILTSLNVSFGQAVILVAAPNPVTTTQVRAPNGTSPHAFLRACSLVLGSELMGLPASYSITSFGFTLSAGTNNVPVTGNFTVYLQNTSDVTYQKGTTWSNVITGMTPAYVSTMTVPGSSLSTAVMLTLTTPFNYTGGGLYVAYDWASTGPFSPNVVGNIATYYAEGTALNPGCASGASATSPPTTLGTTAFRPTFLFSENNPYTNDIQVVGISSTLGKTVYSFNTPQSITAIVKNSGGGTQNNIPVTLNVTGANPFTNTQTITTLAPGTSTTVTFTPYNPQIVGSNSISVSVPTDENTINNVSTYAQMVTCDTWAQNPANASYTGTPIGFGGGSGILATPYLNVVASTLTAIRAAIGTDTSTPGNSGYAVLLSSTGAIIATTPPFVITSAMANTFQQLTFATPQVLTAGTTYYLGLAQVAGTIAFYPAGTSPYPYVNPALYVTTAITGGSFTPLSVSGVGYFGLEAVFATTVNVTATSTSVACGTTATLNALSTTNYSWSTGSTSSSITVTPSVNTIYTVTATNTAGCSNSKTATVTITPLIITAAASSSAVCLNSPVTLTGGGATSYLWSSSTGSLSNNATFTNSPAISTTYSVTGTNTIGCSSNTIVSVIVNGLPNVSISSTVPAICLGESVNLTGNGAVTYTWTNTGTATTVLNNSPTATTIYTVTGTDANGCVNTATLDITVNSVTLSISGSTAICVGKAGSLTVTGADTYLWNGTAPFPDYHPTPTVTTVYTVSGTNVTTGCTGSQTINLVVNPKPAVQASSTKTIICTGESMGFNASGADTYTWTGISVSATAATNASITVSPFVAATNVYTVTGKDANGCVNTATLVLRTDACTGFRQLSGSENNISVFPNPNNGFFTVSLKTTIENGSIEIYNSLGALIRKQTVDADEISINLKNEANGVYLLYVIDKIK